MRLPATLAAIAEVAGLDAAIKIALHHGGGRLYVPSRAPGSALADLIGLDAAQALARDMGGDRLIIPMAKRAIAGRMIADGVSIDQVAIRLKMSRATLYRWRGGADPRQTDFFDKV